MCLFISMYIYTHTFNWCVNTMCRRKGLQKRWCVMWLARSFTYIYIYIHIHVYIYTYTYIHTHVYTGIYTHMCLSLCQYIYIYTYIQLMYTHYLQAKKSPEKMVCYVASKILYIFTYKYVYTYTHMYTDMYIHIGVSHRIFMYIYNIYIHTCNWCIHIICRQKSLQKKWCVMRLAKSFAKIVVVLTWCVCI